MQTSNSELPFASFSEQVLVQNVSHENDLIFMRMNVEVTCTFIRIVLHEHSFCHQGKIQVFIHELAQGAFDFNCLLFVPGNISTPCSKVGGLFANEI